jgi:hypothetical protein
MDRREFAVGVGTFAAALAWAGATEAQPGTAVEGELTLHELADARPIPPTYTGLSYELAQLTDPAFFSAANRDLVAHFRLLSSNGVLRIGGNTSEFCWLRLDSSTAEPKLRVPTGNPDANWMPHRLFAIEPKAVDELAGFLKATGWRVIFGLNFGSSSPQRAADEAAYVAGRAGDRLEYFQIGNEPDFYHDASNGTRPAGWGFADYLSEWTAFAEAIAARVPEARFGGPDVGASSNWVTRFGNEIPAAISRRLAALTGHYYAEGPPNDPRVTIRRLLAGNAAIAGETERIVAAARARGRVYRMTEGNSCYRGGKPGMSDAFAAALWAGDYMLQLAILGCAGVNLHGGSSAFLIAGLGGHTPGMEVARTPQKVRSGFYTPISAEPGAAVRAMPIFYGMKLANQFSGLVPLRVEGIPAGVNATTYGAKDATVLKLAVFNKEEAKALDLSIRMDGGQRKATAWRLEAPALDATAGVRLAGAEIGERAVWRPRVVESIAVKDGAARVHVPAGSAVLVSLD